MIRYFIDRFLDTLASLAAGLVLRAPLAHELAAFDEGMEPVSLSPRHSSACQSCDGRYLAWVSNCSPWSEPRLEPQLCMDAELCDYQFKSRKNIRVMAKHILPVEDYGLTLDQLIRKFPSPDGGILHDGAASN